jgi:DNA-binding MarR family transcriptional regulator
MDEEHAAVPADTVAIIETELLKLVRYLETFGRRGDLYVDVDRAGYLMLRTLDRLGPTSVNAIADRLHLDSSTVTRQVDSLVAAGFVRRQPDIADRRCVSVAITPVGRGAMDGVQRERRRELAALLERWSDTERHELGAAMSRLNRSLEDKAAELGPNRRSRPPLGRKPPAGPIDR